MLRWYFFCPTISVIQPFLTRHCNTPVTAWWRRPEPTPHQDDHPMSSLNYLPGFGNHCATEAVPGALPEGRNSPQQCPHGLYAEQLSGTAFTMSRAENRHSWLYRIRPTAAQGPFAPYPGGTGWVSDFGVSPVTPNR